MQIYFLLAVLKHKKVYFLLLYFIWCKITCFYPILGLSLKYFSLIFREFVFSAENFQRKKYSSFDDEEEEVRDTELFFRIFVGF